MLMRTNGSGPSDFFGVLDIGTSKTVCLIVARPKAGGVPWRRQSVRLAGIGCAPTHGVKAGVVVDVDGAGHSVREAVTRAEQAAEVAVDAVYVAVTGGGMRSRTFEADIQIEGRSVSPADIDRLLAAGRKYAVRDGRILLHMNPIAYRLDEGDPVSDPIGMTGRVLGAELHAVTADGEPLANLLQAVERSELETVGVVPAPCASGLGSATEEERRQGVVCIDMGAGATTLSMFAGGSLRAVDTLAVGGQHITFDIARGLSASFEDAERIKTRCGTLDAAASHDQGMVACTRAGEEELALHQTSNAKLHGIIATRMANLLAHVAERTARLGAGRLAAKRIVLTGGASQLTGLSDFAERILARPVRIGRPEPAPGMPADCCAPPFSTAVGLVQLALDPTAGVRRPRNGSALGRPTRFERVDQSLLDGA